MHSLAMRKKRSRVRLRPAPFFWVFLVANVALGLTTSRITSIVHVRTEGVKAFDRERIEGILTKIQDIPCYKINAKSIESEVMQRPEVDRAEFTRNIFGNGLLTVEYRIPTAKLGGSDSVVLSNDGVLYVATEFPEDVPTLQLPHGGPHALLTLAGNWQPESLAQLAVYARQHYPRIEVKIDIDDRGSVCLNIGSGRVVLGSCDDLQLKLKTLESRLLSNPQELDQVEELNLTSPSAPATVPKKQGKHE